MYNGKTNYRQGLPVKQFRIPVNWSLRNDITIQITLQDWFNVLFVMFFVLFQEQLACFSFLLKSIKNQ